jgi:hypothetical protein
MNLQDDVYWKFNRHATGFLQALDELAGRGGEDVLNAPAFALMMAEQLAARLGATLKLESVPDPALN